MELKIGVFNSAASENDQDIRDKVNAIKEFMQNDPNEKTKEQEKAEEILNDKDTADRLDTAAEIEIKENGQKKSDKSDKNEKIYKQPSINTGKIKGEGTLQNMISDADKFMDRGDQATIQAEQLKDLSGRIYNILLEIGIGASVLIGLILGIKFMLSGVEEKAEVKKMIWVYVIGCIVTFGSFGIWKLVVEILEQV